MKNKIFKTISGKLSAIIMALCCLLACLGVGNFSAQAKTEYPISVVNYDGVDYAGVRIDKNNVDTFKESVDLSSCDLDTPIFQFVITPSKRGDGKLYTPDFEKLTFTLSDTTGKALSVSFIPRKADAPKWNYICGLASGQNQTLLGEHQGNYAWAETESYLADEYAAISPYTFDGYGADFSWFNFYDKDGNKAVAGQNGVIGIYYDREENAIYADMGFKWRDDDENAEWTLTDKYKLAPNGERRWRIRDLDKADYKKGNSIISTIWEGFDDLSNLTFKVDFANKKNNDYSILLLSLGGNALTGNYKVEYKNKGIINKEFTVPKPLYFSKTLSYNFETLGGKVTVKDPDDSVVLDQVAYSDDLKFTPTKAGIYSIEYSVIDPNENVEKTYSFKVSVLQTGGSNLTLNGVERNYLIYDEIDAGFSLSSNIQDDLPEVYLTIKKDGGVVVSKAICPADFIYRFEEDGEYTFEYEVTDYLGQKVVKSFSCNVSSYALKLNDGILKSVLYRANEDIVLPTANDYLMINAVSGVKINPTKVDISVSLNGGLWNALTPSSFANEGVYDVLYKYHYDGEIVSAQRKIAVYKEFPSISVGKVPTNTILVEGSSLDSDSVRVKALKGKAVVFPYGYFSSTESFTVEKVHGESVENVTSQFKSGSYSATFNEEGIYCISAVINVADIYVIRKNIFIDVKTNWIEIETPTDKTFDVGQEISIEVPKAKDFYGNELKNGTYKVLFENTEISVTDGKFTPKSIGVYNIVYTVSDESGSKSCEFIYYLTDKVAPIIKTSNEVKTSSQGSTVELATVQVSDNSELDTGYTISVTFNGKVVSIVDNKFIAKEEGVYEVKIVALDASGNTSTYVYEVQVGARNYAWIIFASIGGALVIAGGIFVIIVLKKVKKKGVENEEKID